MAGSYPDAPAPRMAYDIDGTVSVRAQVSTGTILENISQGQLQVINNENSDAVTVSFFGQGLVSFVFMFPQLRDIVGYKYQYAGMPPSDIETSVNTTNGVDGTWVSQGGVSSQTYNVPPMRTITAVSWSGVKAVKFRASNSGSTTSDITSLHIYGRIASLQTPDRLRMWHPTLDEPLDDNTAADGAHLDWAEVTRSTTADKTFRIKNNSATLTANSIALTTSVLTNASPAIGPQITYSDGGAFATTINIGNLAPDTISGLLTVRRTTASNAALSLWWWRTIAEAGSWT